MKEQQYTKFCKTFLHLISKKFQIDKDEENKEEIDEALNVQLKEHKDISEFMEKYEEVIRLTCKETLKLTKQQQTFTKGKSVPSLTDPLTILRNRTQALRRRFQRTTNNEELRENRKNRYLAEKRKYKAAIRKEKLNSWKKYCTTTPSDNAVYKLASGKTRITAAPTTLHKPDGSKTANTLETLECIAEHLIPEENPHDDTSYHKNIRRLTEQPNNKSMTESSTRTRSDEQ